MWKAPNARGSLSWMWELLSEVFCFMAKLPLLFIKKHLLNSKLAICMGITKWEPVFNSAAVYYFQHNQTFHIADDNINTTYQKGLPLTQRWCMVAICFTVNLINYYRVTVIRALALKSDISQLLLNTSDIMCAAKSLFQKLYL